MVATSDRKPIGWSSAALAVFCAALWGGTAVAIRFAQDDWPPLGTAGLRFAMGTAFMWVWCRVQGQPLALRSHQLRPIVVVAVLLWIQIALFHIGLKETSSGHGSVLIGSNPAWVAVVAHFALRGDRLSWTKIFGLSIAAAGVAAVVSGHHGVDVATQADRPTLWGDAIILASSWLLSVRIVYAKHVLATIEPGQLLFWSNLMGTIMLVTSGLVTEDFGDYQFHLGSTLALLYQGFVVSGFCFAAWTSLLRHHRASELAMFGFAQPVFGILYGVWLRGDLLHTWLALGGAAVAAGIAVVTRENHARAKGG